LKGNQAKGRSAHGGGCRARSKKEKKKFFISEIATGNGVVFDGGKTTGTGEWGGGRGSIERAQ